MAASSALAFAGRASDATWQMYILFLISANLQPENLRTERYLPYKEDYLWYERNISRLYWNPWAWGSEMYGLAKNVMN